MPRKKSPPSYRLHRARNCAVVTICGKDHYLGPYGSAESYEQYARLIAEPHGPDRQTSVRRIGTAVGGSLSVNELILAYWQFVQVYYVTAGEPTGEQQNIRFALVPLRKLYGRTQVAAFGPKALKAVRQHMIDKDLSRGVVNSRINCIRRAFKWAVAEELIPPSVYHAMQAVAGLRYGRTEARETKPIRPVPDLHVCLVLPFVAPQVSAMIKLQRLTGMRAGEIVLMRPCDIDTSGQAWIYEPYTHKNRWRGHTKTVPLGPEAQRIIEPYLDRPADTYLFSPAEADTWRHEHQPPYQGRKRKTPLYPSELRRREKIKRDRHGRKRKPKRPRRDRYDTSTYRRAIEYGIKKAAKVGIKIPHWHPHQLKHSRGTEVRKQLGVEAAQIALGNADAAVTLIYAERDSQRAEQIAMKMG